MNKKLLSVILSSFLVITSSLSVFAGGIINQKESEITLSKGVKYKSIHTFTEYGVQNVNIVVMDLNDPNVKLDVLFNKNGFTNRQTVSQMVKNENDVLAAINGDFFSMSTPSFSLGPMVKDGKVISNAHYELNKYASFLMDTNKNVFLTYVKPDVNVFNKNNNSTVYVAAINKPSKYFGNIVIYTSEYQKNSPGANNTYYDLCEVVVENNVVKEVRYGQPSTPIPDNGYIILAGGSNGGILKSSFNVGDEVNMNTAFNLDYNNINLALGGGSLILKDGNLYPPTQRVKGKSQRSALGITPDNKLILFTTDGRLPNVIGMEEEDVANYMKSLGCKDAMLFDGGGSTELIVKNEIVNTLVNNTERSIVNSLAIKSIGEKGAFSNIEASVDKNFGYTGEKFKVKVGTFDGDFDPLNIPLDQIKFSVSGIEGYFDKNIFIPTSGGRGNIIASYRDKSASVPIDIVQKQTNDSNLIQSLPQDGYNIAFLGDMNIKNEKLLDVLIKLKYMDELQKNSKNTVFISNNNATFESKLNTQKFSAKGSYSSSNIDNSTVISLDNSSGTLYKVQGQWDFLKNSLNTPLNNIFVVLNSKSQLTSGEENEIFKKTLYEKALQKNVYVIYRGNDFSQTVEGNVRYISIPDYESMYKNNFSTDYKYLLINIKDNNIKYSYKNIFNK